jgi:hypothetical protein
MWVWGGSGCEVGVTMWRRNGSSVRRQETSLNLAACRGGRTVPHLHQLCPVTSAMPCVVGIGLTGLAEEAS